MKGTRVSETGVRRAGVRRTSVKGTGVRETGVRDSGNRETCFTKSGMKKKVVLRATFVMGTRVRKSGD